MTPFANKLRKLNLLNKKDDKIEVHHYDFSKVKELIEQTAINFNNSEIGHGGLLICPEEQFWFEYKNDKGYIAFACGYDQDYNTIGVTCVIEINGNFSKCTFGINFDKENFYILKYGEDFKGHELSKGFAFILVAQLLILNAPYGIDRETISPHKGQAKEAKRRGYELKPHHIIKLSKSAPPAEYQNGIGSGSPKAFHFVRSHLRQYKTGKRAIVKAHWRGDPRLGIHNSSYEIRP